MADKRIDDVPEIPEDQPETEGNGIDIPVPEEAPARGRGRRGRRRAEPSEADSGLLPESGAPAGTVYTLGPQNEFGDVEDVSFESSSEGADEPSAPKKGAALDISDIPNAVAAPDASKSSGKSRKRKKRRPAQPRNTAAASEKTSVPAAEDSEQYSVPAAQDAPAEEPASVPEELPADVNASENADKAPSGAPETSADAEVSAEVADAAPKAARSKRREKRRPTQADRPDSGDASSEAESSGASRDAVSSPVEESSTPAKKSKKKSRRPAAQAEDAAEDAAETTDIPSEASEKPPRAPKPKAPAASLLLSGILTENPLLFGLVGVFPAVAAASTGLTALAAGICVLAALIVTNLAASLIGDRLPRRLREALMLLLAACVSSGELLALEALLPETADALGIFVPLVAVCGLTLSRESFAAEHHPVSALIDAAACGAGFTAALTLFGVIREVIASRTLFGLDISVQGLPPVLVFAAPAGGLLLLGLLSGAARYVRTKRRASKRGSKEAEL